MMTDRGVRIARLQAALLYLGQELTDTSAYMLHHDVDADIVMTAVANLLVRITNGEEVTRYEMRKALAVAVKL